MKTGLNSSTTYVRSTGNHPSGHNNRMYHALTVPNAIHRSNHARAIDRLHSHQGRDWRRLRRRERVGVKGVHLNNPQAYTKPMVLPRNKDDPFVLHAADHVIGAVPNKHHTVKRDALF